jgi:hypothetical protein
VEKLGIGGDLQIVEASAKVIAALAQVLLPLFVPLSFAGERSAQKAYSGRSTPSSTRVRHLDQRIQEILEKLAQRL